MRQAIEEPEGVGAPMPIARNDQLRVPQCLSAPQCPHDSSRSANPPALSSHFSPTPNPYLHHPTWRSFSLRSVTSALDRRSHSSSNYITRLPHPPFHTLLSLFPSFSHSTLYLQSGFWTDLISDNFAFPQAITRSVLWSTLAFYLTIAISGIRAR